MRALSVFLDWDIESLVSRRGQAVHVYRYLFYPPTNNPSHLVSGIGEHTDTGCSFQYCTPSRYFEIETNMVYDLLLYGNNLPGLYIYTYIHIYIYIYIYKTNMVYDLLLYG